MIITGAEKVDETKYHLITNKGVFLLDINIGYNLYGIEIPSFETIEQAIIILNS